MIRHEVSKFARHYRGIRHLTETVHGTLSQVAGKPTEIRNRYIRKNRYIEMDLGI
jgi:hypothetical protein